MRRLLPLLLAPAALGETIVSVLVLEAEDAPMELAQAAAEGLRAAAPRVGWKLGPDKDFVEMKLIFCSGEERPDCLARAGKSLGAAMLVYGALRGRGPDMVVSLKLLDVDRAKVERSVEDRVPKKDATAERVKAEAARWAALLAGQKPGGTLKVVVRPPGAEVLVDGKSVGTAGDEPLVVADAEPGRRQVEVQRVGFKTWSEVVSIASGETASVDVRLVEAAPPSPLAPVPGPTVAVGVRPGPPGRAWRVAFWIGAGTTVAAAGLATWAGLSIAGIEDDKEEAIAESRAGRAPGDRGYINAGSGEDACGEAEREAVTAVSDACDRGRSRAKLSNVLLGVTGVAAAATGLFFWQGYLAAEAGGEGASLSVGGIF